MAAVPQALSLAGQKCKKMAAVKNNSSTVGPAKWPLPPPGHQTTPQPGHNQSPPSYATRATHKNPRGLRPGPLKLQKQGRVCVWGGGKRPANGPSEKRREQATIQPPEHRPKGRGGGGGQVTKSPHPTAARPTPPLASKPCPTKGPAAGEAADGQVASRQRARLHIAPTQPGSADAARLRSTRRPRP